MNTHQKEQIERYRQSGVSFAQIAEMMNLPISTVKSYCYRNPVKPIKAEATPQNICLECGKELSMSHFRPRRFCSDTCRYRYWGKQKNRKSASTQTCTHCGKAFSDYAKRSRKYCSHACYIAARYGGERCE